MKKIDFITPIKNLKGQAFKTESGDMTVGQVVANTLAISKPKNPQKDAARQYHLALRIFSSKGLLEMEDADLNLIRESLNKNELQYSTLILGQVFETIEKES